MTNICKHRSACPLWEVTHGAKDTTGWITAPFPFFTLYFRDIHLDFCLRREGRFRFGISFLPYWWPFKRIFLMLEKKDKTRKEKLLWGRKILCLTCHIFAKCQKVWKMVRKMTFIVYLYYATNCKATKFLFSFQNFFCKKIWILKQHILTKASCIHIKFFIIY